MSAGARDRAVLRDLARGVAAIAHDPVNLERRAAWTALHDLSPVRPMILAEHFGVADRRKPFDPAPACEGPWERGLERRLRERIWTFEVLRDDHVVEPRVTVGWKVEASDYGVHQEVHRAEDGDRFTSYRWDAPLADLGRDFARLTPRTFAVDRAGTLVEKARHEEAIGDILPVRIRGAFWWTMGMTWPAITLVGLEGLMLLMYDDPDGLHRLMAFLRDDHLAFASWLEREGLLSLNDEDDYVGSGSTGYTTDLPSPEARFGRPVRTRDLWVLLESQETVGVGPDLYGEFVFPYQRSIAERFGLVYHGCCEPVHTRWEVVRRMPGLRSVSIAPLCNQEAMGPALGARYVFSRKPNPTLVSTGRFDEELIRDDLRRTLRAARGCPLEIIMKDVHTLDERPERLARWVALAREEIAGHRQG
jgi:hypothetical protein